MWGKRWSVIVAHRRAGKSIVAIMRLIDEAIKCKYPHGRYVYLAPYLRQAKAIAWDYLKRYTQKIPGIQVNESELHITLPNGAQIRIHGGDNADSLRGSYLDGVVLDELAQLSKELWDAVLRPQLADHMGWALFMGTPAGINLLSEMYFGAKDNPDWYVGIFTVYETNSIPADEVAALKKGMTENAFNREMLCSFDAGTDNTLLSVTEVEAATKRHFNEGAYERSPRILGIDVALFGDDRCVVYPRQGLYSGKPWSWSKLPLFESAAKCAVIIQQYQPHAVFIDNGGGYGAGVAEKLTELGYRPIPIQFGGKALDQERFVDRRMEMYWAMAEWVKESGFIHSIQELKQDLVTPTYTYDPRGRMRLESKEKIKARGLPSTDYADALALTFAAPVPAPSLGDFGILGQAQHGGRQGRVESEYDPLAEMRR